MSRRLYGHSILELTVDLLTSLYIGGRELVARHQ